MSLKPVWLQRIGRGGYAEVWEVQVPGHPGLYAAKRFLIPFVQFPDAQNVIREVLLLRRLRGSCFLPRIFGVFFTQDRGDNSYLTIFMERLAGDLRQLFASPPPTLSLFRRYCFEAVECVAWLHACGVVHSDLKPDNFLISEAGGMRVTDFNHANVVGRAGGLGTRFYRASELLLCQPCGTAMDIWALGCVLLEIVWWWLAHTAPPPFWAPRCATLSPSGKENHITRHDQLFAVLNLVGCAPAEEFAWIRDNKMRLFLTSFAKYRVKRSIVDEWVDDPLVAELLRGCLQFDPQQRLSAERLLELPLFFGLERRKEAQRDVKLPECDWASQEALDELLAKEIRSFSRQKHDTAKHAAKENFFPHISFAHKLHPNA